jgi:hypothetical protein
MAETRTPSIWLLSREVNGVGGERYTQNVSVYAGSAREAIALVASEFARLARITGKAEPPYQATPDWSVEQVKLDAAKLITSSITS